MQSLLVPVCFPLPPGGGHGAAAGAADRVAVVAGAGPHAAHSCQVPLPLQHAGPVQGKGALLCLLLRAAGAAAVLKGSCAP